MTTATLLDIDVKHKCRAKNPIVKHMLKLSFNSLKRSGSCANDNHAYNRTLTELLTNINAYLNTKTTKKEQRKSHKTLTIAT